MKTVRISASKTYDIKIGSNLLDTIGQEIQSLGRASKVCIVSDSNVFPIYGQRIRNSLETVGLQVHEFVFPAGEASKNAGTFISLLNQLAQMQLTRTDIIIALGGGVVGDLTGFAAACYLRGIRFVQVPTTLLAAVDSSVGGKTAIDLDAGKNLAGAFYQPSLVICDTDTLQTLPSDVFRDGCAEVIKYAVLYDPDLFNLLASHGLDFDREEVITRCVQWKQQVVMDDEFDTGSRMKLNLGHTIGHGVEAKSDFTVTHGMAVAIGMAIVSRSAAALGYCSKECCDQIICLLQRFGLPVTTEYTAQDLYTFTLSDKKRSGGSVRLIVPKEIGFCEILPTPIEELKSFIQAGRSYGSYYSAR